MCVHTAVSPPARLTVLSLGAGAGLFNALAVFHGTYWPAMSCTKEAPQKLVERSLIEVTSFQTVGGV